MSDLWYFEGLYIMLDWGSFYCSRGNVTAVDCREFRWHWIGGNCTYKLIVANSVYVDMGKLKIYMIVHRCVHFGLGEIDLY